MIRSVSRSRAPRKRSRSRSRSGTAQSSYMPSSRSPRYRRTAAASRSASCDTAGHRRRGGLLQGPLELVDVEPEVGVGVDAHGVAGGGQQAALGILAGGDAGLHLPQGLAEAPPGPGVGEVGPEGAGEEVAGVGPLPVHDQVGEQRAPGAQGDRLEGHAVAPQLEAAQQADLQGSHAHKVIAGRRGGMRPGPRLRCGGWGPKPAFWDRSREAGGARRIAASPAPILWRHVTITCHLAGALRRRRGQCASCCRLRASGRGRRLAGAGRAPQPRVGHRSP